MKQGTRGFYDDVGVRSSPPPTGNVERGGGRAAVVYLGMDKEAAVD
ncbi:hypothetical protein [Candidatus Thiosymbion oneisti]|nr:hypothetical protein [Candidatus Thiosymbion oneisti]